MPVIAVNLSQSLFSKVSQLVKDGLYASPEQLLEIAAFNQVALEGGLSPSEAVTRGQTKGVAPQPRPEAGTARRKRTRKGPDPRKATRAKKTRVADRGALVPDEEIRAMSARVARSAIGACPVPLQAVDRPATERVWGQVNRLFPLKFVCRWVGAANDGQSEWLAHDSFIDRLGEDAATVGSLLDGMDLKAQRKRDALLATGLPRRGNSASRDRFVTQFVARTTRAGEIYPGAVCQFALAEFDGERLGLTDRGLELALLENPVLDSDPTEATETLTAAERAFLLDQVKRFVPGELEDFRALVSAVRAGASTPDSLISVLRASLPAEWSDLMIRTQVAGLVARMADLGLLIRHWQGRHVSYALAADLSGIESSGG